MIQLSSEQAREALISHVASLGSVPQSMLRDSVSIKSVQPMSGYNYTLDTFMERRTLSFVQEAHRPDLESKEDAANGDTNGDGDDDGTMPDMWDVPVKCEAIFVDAEAKAIFVDAEAKVTMPHTSMTLPCTECYSSGKTRCAECAGSGTRRCAECVDDSSASRLGRTTPVAPSRDSSISSRLRSLSVRPPGDAVASDDADADTARRKSAAHGVAPASFPSPSPSAARSPRAATAAAARSRASLGVTPAKYHTASASASSSTTPEPASSRSSRFRRRFSRNKTRTRSASVKAKSSRRKTMPIASPLGRARKTSFDDSDVDERKSAATFATRLFSRRSPKATDTPPSSFNRATTADEPLESDSVNAHRRTHSTSRSPLGRPVSVSFVSAATGPSSPTSASAAVESAVAQPPVDSRARRDCKACEGRGLVKCDRCGGKKDAACDTCEGSGFVKRFMQLAVTWTTQTAEVPITPSKLVKAMPSTLPRNPYKSRPKPIVAGSTTDSPAPSPKSKTSKANGSASPYENGEVLSPALKAELIENFIRGDRGDVVFHKEGTTVAPLTRKDFPSEKLVTTSVRLLAEEHRSTAAKILRQRHFVEYVPVFRIKYTFKGRDLEFWVYGSQRRVFTEDFQDQSERCVLL